MTSEQLRRGLKTQPIRPFVIHSANGGRLCVSHPKMIMFYENEQTCAVFRSDETVHVVDPRLVIDAEVARRR